MELRKRLERLGVFRGQPNGQNPPLPDERLRRPIVPGALAAALGLFPRRNSQGTYYARTLHFAVTDLRSAIDVPFESTDGWRRHDLLQAPLVALGWLAGIPLTDPDPKRIVYLDTETTGLAGGTGTLVVVAGIARVCGDSIRFEQFVLLDPSEERAFLAGLSESLAGAELLVTFNGRSFDWPLLQTRFTLNRLRDQIPDLSHLDLLYPSRRLYGAELESCRLTSLERHLLAVRRQDDLPGHEVPWRYRLLLDQGSSADFLPVLRHNRDDVLSLLALTAQLAQRVACGLAGDVSSRETSSHLLASELLALAIAAEGKAELHRAEMLYRRAMETSTCRRAPGRIWFRAARRLSFLYRKRKQWKLAADIWEQIAELYPPGRLFALVELAKYHEHRRRDLPTALATTERALEEALSRRLRRGTNTSDRERANLLRRRARLLRRLASLHTS